VRYGSCRCLGGDRPGSRNLEPLTKPGPTGRQSPAQGRRPISLGQPQFRHAAWKAARTGAESTPSRALAAFQAARGMLSFLPRASAFGLGPGLCSTGLSGRIYRERSCSGRDRVGPARDSVGPAQNPVGPARNPVGLAQNPVGLAQNPVGLAENPVGFSENPVGLAENPVGFSENPVGLAQNPVGFARNPVVSRSDGSCSGVEKRVAKAEGTARGAKWPLPSF
jgi:hypothetical protein